MKKIIKQFVFVINALFFIIIIFLFNNVIDLQLLLFILCFLWGIVLWRTYHKKLKTSIDTLIFVLIILLNVVTLLNLPKFTYSEATNIVIEEYKQTLINANIVLQDNKTVKELAPSDMHAILNYRMYSIILTDGYEEWSVWFDPYTGEYEETTSN